MHWPQELRPAATPLPTSRRIVQQPGSPSPGSNSFGDPAKEKVARTTKSQLHRILWSISNAVSTGDALRRSIPPRICPDKPMSRSMHRAAPSSFPRSTLHHLRPGRAGTGDIRDPASGWCELPDATHRCDGRMADREPSGKRTKSQTPSRGPSWTSAGLIDWIVSGNPTTTEMGGTLAGKPTPAAACNLALPNDANLSKKSVTFLGRPGPGRRRRHAENGASHWRIALDLKGLHGARLLPADARVVEIASSARYGAWVTASTWQ